MFARVREALLALCDGGPTNREGAGKRCEDCLDIWFALIGDQGRRACCGVAHFQCMGRDPGALHVKMTSLMSTISVDWECIQIVP